MGVDAVDEEDGESGVDGSVRDLLNWEALDVFALAEATMGEAATEDIGCPSGVGVEASWVEGGCLGILGPTLVTSPFWNSSSISFVAGSTSSSLSPASPPTRSPSSSFPRRTAAFKVDDCEAGSTEPPNECEGKEDDADERDALNRDTAGFGGGDARVASRGTT